MKFGTLFIALLLAGSTAQAQIPTPTSEAGPWSLDDCIRYAHEHNIQIQQQALQVEQRSVELNTSRHSRLPDLGANLGTNFSFGRSLISNNTYADNNQVLLLMRLRSVFRPRCRSSWADASTTKSQRAS